eukprot:g4063.t1
MLTASLAPAVTLASYDFTAGSLASTAVTTFGTASDITLGSTWEANVGNGNLERDMSASGPGQDINGAANMFSFTFTVSGLAANERLVIDDVFLDYKTFLIERPDFLPSFEIPPGEYPGGIFVSAMQGGSVIPDPGPEPRVERPNIVLIMADDIAYDNNFGAYGARESWTPRLDRLAAEGITFEHAYSTPKCTPSRVKIMTGRSGIRNYEAFGSLPSGETTFAHMLKKAGYKTHIAGKWQLDGPGGTETGSAGFDSWFLWNTRLADGSRYWKPEFEVNGKFTAFGGDDYGPDLCVDSILEFVEENKESPFFVYYPMLLVHGPFEPTPDSADRESKDQQKNFEDMVRYMDKCVGRVLDGLEKAGVNKNTVVLFCTDNGTNRVLTYESFGEIVKGKKGVPHDRGTHSPMIVHQPGVIPAGLRCGDLIDFSDVLPTLAEITDAALPSVELDGRSFWAQCQGLPGNPREWIFQYFWPKDSDPTLPELGGGNIVWAQNKSYKLHGNGLFFDIVNDREELNPIPGEKLTDEQRAVRAMLEKAIASMPAENPHYPGNPPAKIK